MKSNRHDHLLTSGRIEMFITKNSNVDILYFRFVLYFASGYASSKPAYSELVPKPRTREGYDRKGIQHKNT